MHSINSLVEKCIKLVVVYPQPSNTVFNISKYTLLFFNKNKRNINSTGADQLSYIIQDSVSVSDLSTKWEIKKPFVVLALETKTKRFFFFSFF